MKGIVILGSTGSIGRQTLDIVRTFPQEFSVVGLAGWNNLELLVEQVQEFQPKLTCCQGMETARDIPALEGCHGVSMEEMVCHPDVDLVMVATTGKAGLVPTMEALQAGKEVALANKEPIVMAGEMIMAQARRYNAPLLPVDSEPSAIWQCLRGEDKEVARLIITASGGPFRNRPLEEMKRVTPAEALQHPTWKMGKKITVDSATLMNKAFEVIESHWLFDMPWEQVEVVIHPQSIIHSMVEFVDGSVKAQLGPPDMRLPIQYALFHPRRIANASLPRFNPVERGSLTFETLDPHRYPCFQLALETAGQGGTFPTVLSAADEVAVELFLEGRIGFEEIHHLVSQVIEAHQSVADGSLEAIFAADTWARVKLLELASR